MGFVELVTGEGTKDLKQKPAEPKRRGFYPAEKIDLADGWRQIIAGEWRGVGLLDVMEPLLYEWGRRIIIAEPGRDRRKLQTYYPGLMIFEPKEFQDAVNGWPDNIGVVLAKRMFNGDIVEVG
jgi:hypothetical protein